MNSLFISIVRKLIIGVVVGFTAFFAFTILTSCGNEDVSQEGNKPVLNLWLQYPMNGDGEPEIKFANDQEQKIPVEVIDRTNGVAKQIVQVMIEGDGTQVQSGMSVDLEYVNYSVPGLHKDVSTWDGDVPDQKLVVFAGDESVNSLSQVLIGLREGAYIVIATPGWNDDSTALDETGTNYSLQVVHIKSVKNTVTKADGVSVPEAQLNPSLPKVTLAADGTPSIKIPASFQVPDGSVSQELKIGSGDTISDDTTLSFAYTAWNLSGDVLQSTWEEKVPITARVSNLTDSWQNVLIGSKIGSQFLIIAPNTSETEVGDSSNATKDGDYVIYVVDLLEKSF